MTYIRNRARFSPVIVAHRGASGLFPENTLLSIENARSGGADIVEIDVRLTVDGFVVLMHDVSVARTTNGTGRVRDLTLAKLKSLDAGHRFSRDCGETFPFRASNLKVPLLAEVLTAFPDLVFQIELKDNSIKLAQGVLQILRELQAWERIQIATAYTNLTWYISRSEPKAALAHSAIDPFTFVICSVLRQRFCPSFHTGFIDLPVQLCRYQSLIVPAIREAKRQGLKARAFTVNDLDVMKTLIVLGIQGFFTDYPAEARLLADTLNSSEQSNDS